MLALAYQDLPDIDETPPLDDADFSCLAEVREVLARHGRLGRFGVTLLHNHFPINEGEVLVESCDDVGRTLTMRVEPSSVLASASLTPTSWRLTDGAALIGCYKACVAVNGDHKRNKHVQR